MSYINLFFAEAVIEQQLQELLSQINDHSTDVTSLQHQISSIENDIFLKETEKTKCRKQLENMQNIADRRLKLLVQNNRHVYDAAIWLRSNKRLFRGTVHEPLFSMVRFLSLYLKEK